VKTLILGAHANPRLHALPKQNWVLKEVEILTYLNEDFVRLDLNRIPWWSQSRHLITKGMKYKWEIRWRMWRFVEENEFWNGISIFVILRW